MSSDDQRISTDQLLDMAKPVHVDTLTRWEQSPWTGDVGLRSLQSTVFGQTGLVFTHGDTVLYGDDTVDAQRHQPDDDGFVPVVDLAQAGFNRQKAEAFVLAIWTNHRRTVPDHTILAELVTELYQYDHDVSIAAGWDADELDALLTMLDKGGHLPSLDDGMDPDMADMQYTISLKVPFDVYERWMAATDDDRLAVVEQIGL